jgi:putative restriction endonuclease
MICDAVGQDIAELEVTASPGIPVTGRRARRAGFAEQVLRAYAYRCAMCGFDGALGRNPVAVQAAHVRWHSQDGPGEVANALALCALHHVLLDLGVLGLIADLRVRVSELSVARGDAGRAVDALAGQWLLEPRPGRPAVEGVHITWHRRQVFKGVATEAA